MAERAPRAAPAVRGNGRRRAPLKKRRVEELQDKGRELRKQRLADALRATTSSASASGVVKRTRSVAATFGTTNALRADFRRSLSCQNDAADWAAARGT